MKACFAFPLSVRRLPAPAHGLKACDRAAAVVEMALVLPLFLALAMGILVYGQYFMLAHSVQQAANDGARAGIVGLNPDDRAALAVRAADRSMKSVSGYTPQNRRIAASESTEAFTVTVTYEVPADSFLRSSFVPSPGHVIQASATFELPVD